MINGISLFANVGIGESYFEEIGINICLANELIQDRANFYSSIYPKSEMICGDFTNPDIFKILKQKYFEKQCEFRKET